MLCEIRKCCISHVDALTQSPLYRLYLKEEGFLDWLVLLEIIIKKPHLTFKGEINYSYVKDHILFHPELEESVVQAAQK